MTDRHQYGVLGEILDDAAAQGSRPALVCGEERMDHATLDRRCRARAAQLQRLGLAPGDRVAVALAKSIEAVVAMFGTLRAGGCYVPVNRHQPLTRIRHILRDSQAAVVVTDQSFARSGALDNLPGSPRVVLVDGDAPAEEEPAPTVSRPDDVAFVLYTSGSTGRPKGVRITHRNLLTFINWALGELRVGPDDVFSNHASFTFDLSTFDLYAALAAGASVVLISEEQTRSPEVLAGLVAAERISVWYSVPSTLQLISSAGSFARHDCSSLRYILFAGEVFPINHLQRLAALFPETALYNLYGPTETNVCTYHRFVARDRERTTPLPIGRPLPGLQARVVDENGRRVEPSAVGELLIEGPCVTPGYWSGHERSGQDHRRHIHATGDLVAWVDGELVYHGRRDNMVKLRGYRVELGEIESALAQHPALEQVAVVPVAISGETRLLACFSVRPGATAPSLVALKIHCAGHLPPYMIPHLARSFPALVRNANGKIDRARLAALVQGELEGRREAPGSTVPASG